MKKVALFLLAFVVVAGTAGCGGGGDDEDDCMDVVQKACNKFYDCGFVLLDNGVPIDAAQCASYLYPNTAGQTDEQCRNEWSEGEDLACGDYYDWF